MAPFLLANYFVSAGFSCLMLVSDLQGLLQFSLFPFFSNLHSLGWHFLSPLGPLVHSFLSHFLSPLPHLPPSQAMAERPIRTTSAELKINFFMVVCLIVWYKCKAATSPILLVGSY